MGSGGPSLHACTTQPGTSMPGTPHEDTYAAARHYRNALPIVATLMGGDKHEVLARGQH
jgi:hypothetical protein